MTLGDVRRHALSLDAVTEAPHHAFASFRVRDSIFETVPPAGEVNHVFVGEEDRERGLALYPQWVEKRFWGKQAVGLRVTLAAANPSAVLAMVDRAYETRIAKIAAARKPARR